MMVVSDTTPLRYLAEIGGLEGLPLIWGEVICPLEVIAECCHHHAPSSLREWALSPPPWLHVRKVRANAELGPLLRGLDPGEAAALRLAVEAKADLVLIDERRGRAAARRLGLDVTGTLGVLIEVALRGFIEFEAALEELLSRTNFRVDPAVIAAARARLVRRG